MGPTPNFPLPKVLFWLLLCALGAFLVVAWLPFYPAIGIAVILGLLTRNWFKRLKASWFKRTSNEDRAGTLAALQVVFGTLLLIVTPLFLVGAMIGAQVSGFVRDFQDGAPIGVSAWSPQYVTSKIDEAIGPVLKERFGSDFKTHDWFDSNRPQITANIQKGLSSLGAKIGYGALMLVVGFLTLFFFLRDGHKLREPIINLLPLPRERIDAIGNRVASTADAVLVGVVLVSVIQGLLAGISYAVAGVPNTLMWGGATVIACMIPLLGAPLIYAPLGLILLSQGKTWQAILVLGVGFGLVSQIDNILRPFFIGAKTNLHPMAIFFSLLGGVLLLGPIGLFLGPMLLSLFLGLLDAARPAENAPAESL